MVDYFKGLAEETGLPYQKLIDLYPSRLREEAQETDDEVSGGWLPLKSVGPLRRARGPCF